MNRIDLLLWVILPYVSITVFVAGHIWRYRQDKFGWTTRSTQILERRLLRWGSLLFHWGILGVIGGHVLGLLVPKALAGAIGIAESTYHAISVGAGTVAGVATVAGLLILLYRRLRVRRVAATTTDMDLAVYFLLVLLIGLGMAETVGRNLLGGGYDYRTTVAVWFRGLFIFDPKPSLMASAPLVYQLHALAAWLLFALWPFSRLVHAWTVPLGYLGRSSILYRSRTRPAKSPNPSTP